MARHALMISASLLGTVALAGAATAPPATGAATAPRPAETASASPATADATPSMCAIAPAPSEYYAVELVTTKRLPGSGHAEGMAYMTFAPSPYGVALAPDGSYVYDLNIQITDLKPPTQGTLVAWITTPQVDQIQRVGALDADFRAKGQVSWNKFLVVVTLEPNDDPDATTWSGPIAFRGMSRSGMMHTMAGHGPFQQEKCAKYGYQ